MAERVAARRGATAKRAEAPARTTKLRVVRAPVRRQRTDPAAAAKAARTNVILLLVPAALLTAIGVVEVFSASSVYAFTTYDNSFWFLERQAIYAAIGIGALLVTARMRYAAWRRLSGPLLMASVALLLLALHPTAGSSVYGASRWIGLGPFTLQPSEIAKLSLVAFAAAVLTRKEGKLDNWMHLALPLGPVVLIVAAIVMLQRDLGTTIVIVGSVLLMLFVAGARLRHLLITGVLTLGGLAYLIFGEAYRRARFLSFFDPWKDPLNSGYQLIQGLIALGSGGWFGVGLGASRQKWAYLPNAHTDFIFAVLGEEMGLLGEFVVLIAFGVMVYAGIRIAVRAPDTFGRLLAAGITSWIGLQAIVNLGAVTGLLPITGVPLPFVSFGGTALIVTLGAVGVLASIARAGGLDASGGGVNVVIAAGGTGGHIFPALSLADALVRDHGAHVRFIGSPDGQEAIRVPAAGYRFDAVEAAPFLREVSMRAAKAPVIAVRSMFACASLVRRADVAVGTGGYVSVAPMLAARRAHVPIVLHEPNAIPGLANRLLARSATSVAITFEDARGRIPGHARIETIGYPVRAAILDVPIRRAELAEEARSVLGLEPERRTVMVTGGSQGALHLDQVVAAALPLFAERGDLQLLVVTGPGREGELAGASERAGAARVTVVPFLDRMELGYAAADLVVARAGGTTIAELAVCGLPSILVPYPHATENHQDANAREMERIDAAVVIADGDLTPAVFATSVMQLVDDVEKRASMSDHASRWAKPDAADRFASLVAEAVRT